MKHPMFRTYSKIVLLLWLCLLGIAMGQSGTKYFFEQGNQAYREGNYEAALEWYRKIVDSGFEASQVYYNMGNCYYKQDRTGLAVLYYEKARKLNPNDREINENLQLANLKVKDRIELPPQFFLFAWWDQMMTFLNISQLARLTLVFYVTAIALLIALFFLRPGGMRRATLYALVGFAILTLFSTYVLLSNIHVAKNRVEAVVLSSSINVLSEPNENSTDIFLLHEGAKVVLDEQRGEWVKISLPDGKAGWVRQAYLGVI